MKKLLSILSICLVFVSCSPDRVLYDELTERGTDDKPTMYFEGKPFTGVAFDIWEDGQLHYEGTYKDGKQDGLFQTWYDNGQLAIRQNYKDGKYDGLFQSWYKNGQLEYERNYKDGVIIN